MRSLPPVAPCRQCFENDALCREAETAEEKPRKRRWGAAPADMGTATPAPVAAALAPTPGLAFLQSLTHPPPPTASASASGSLGLADAIAKARQAAQMSQQIANAMSALGNINPHLMSAMVKTEIKQEPTETAEQRAARHAQKFTLDADGNLIDASGNVVKTERNVSSLKVNNLFS